MIVGTVTVNGVPVVSLAIAGRAFPAIIDTGFNGDLEMPEVVHGSVNARFIGRTRSLLAAGQIIEEDLFHVEVDFDGRHVTAEATFAPGDEVLIGTHFLRAYRLEIDFVDGVVSLHRIG